MMRTSRPLMVSPAAFSAPKRRSDSARRASGGSDEIRVISLSAGPVCWPVPARLSATRPSKGARRTVSARFFRARSSIHFWRLMAASCWAARASVAAMLALRWAWASRFCEAVRRRLSSPAAGSAPRLFRACARARSRSAMSSCSLALAAAAFSSASRARVSVSCARAWANAASASLTAARQGRSSMRASSWPFFTTAPARSPGATSTMRPETGGARTARRVAAACP